MNLAEIVQFNKELDKAEALANEGTLGLLRNAFSHLTHYMLSIENQINLTNRILEFNNLGWTNDEIIGDHKTLNLYSLAQLLDPTDVIGEITDKHIEIKKRSGTVHYYEKRPHKSSIR